MISEKSCTRIQRAGLFLFAFTLPISHVPAQFGIGCVALGWLLQGIFLKKWFVRWHALMIPLLVYLIWNILASALSDRPLHSLGAVLDNEWPVLIMLFIFWLVDDANTLRKLVFAFLASSAVAVVYGTWQSVGGVEFYRGVTLDPMGWGFFRAVGFYSFYLTFAGLAMMSFCFSSGFALESRRWQFIALVVLSALAIVGTFARSIWLGLAAAISVFAFTRGKRTGLLVSLVLVCVVAVGIISVPALRSRAASIVDPGQNETRLNLWKTALMVAQDNPVIGVGEDNWDHVFEKYRVEGFYDTTVHPHNDYLTVLVASGIPGITSFLAMWGVALTAGFGLIGRAQNQVVKAVSVGATTTLLGFLIAGFFQNYYGTFINCLGWWFVVGLLLSAQNIHEQMSASGNLSSSPT